MKHQCGFAGLYKVLRECVESAVASGPTPMYTGIAPTPALPPSGR